MVFFSHLIIPGSHSAVYTNLPSSSNQHLIFIYDLSLSKTVCSHSYGFLLFSSDLLPTSFLLYCITTLFLVLLITSFFSLLFFKIKSLAFIKNRADSTKHNFVIINRKATGYGGYSFYSHSHPSKLYIFKIGVCAHILANSFRKPHRRSQNNMGLTLSHCFPKHEEPS